MAHIGEEVWRLLRDKELCKYTSERKLEKEREGDDEMRKPRNAHDKAQETAREQIESREIPRRS